MDDRTRTTLETVAQRLAETAEQLGELTLAHERLAHRRAGFAHRAEAEHDRPVGTDDVDALDLEGAPDPEVTLDPEDARDDRITYLKTARSALYRLLFTVDFTLTHDRVDRALLADARTTLVDGVDAVDACLMLDGVGLPPVTADG